MTESAHLLGTLDEEDCAYCDGNLMTGSYEDSDAIVCDNCGTSAAQPW